MKEGGRVLFDEIKNVIEKSVLELEPVEFDSEYIDEFETINFDYSEKDNSNWLDLIKPYIANAKRFEIHCWNEETELIESALKYGRIKKDKWKYGKIVEGDVTQQFTDFVLGFKKPDDTEIYNKMTPFFNIFLDDVFQSCHYGTENFFKKNKIMQEWFL